MEQPEATRRLVVMNCPHLAIFSAGAARESAPAARSWYMFFFQIPWLPETLLGARPRLGRRRRHPRAAVRQDAITDDDLQRAARRRQPAGRAAQRDQLLPRRVPRPRGAAQPAPLAAPLPPRRPPVPAAARALEDWPKIIAADAAHLGRAGRRARKELTLGMEPLFTGAARHQVRRRCPGTGCSRSRRRW